MNYRDLQNISNLSQQILVEGANEEHNVLNRWPYTSPYLQEAYLEVVENQQLNDGYKRFPYDKVKAKAKKLAPGRDDLGREPLTGPKAPNTPQKDLDRSTRLRLSAHLHHSEGPKQRERINKGPESLLYKKRSKTVSDNTEKKKYFPNRLRRADGQGIADSYDYYDIILSHLLDEGYAETVEAAESIMVNMSEDWRESIVEEVLDEELSGSRKEKASQILKRKLRDVETLRNLAGRKRTQKTDYGSGNRAARRAGIEVKDSRVIDFDN